MLMLCIAQIGPALILFPAVGWMFWTGDSAWGGALLVLVAAGRLDRQFPARAAHSQGLTCRTHIFSGVIGGLLGFGLVGIFVGPGCTRRELYAARCLAGRSA